MAFLKSTARQAKRVHHVHQSMTSMMRMVISSLIQADPESKESPLSAEYLPPYQNLTNALSWSGHVDAEWLANTRESIRHSFPNILGHVGLAYDTEKGNLWPGGFLAIGVLGVVGGGSESGIVDDTQGASSIWAASLIRLYDFTYCQQVGRMLSLKAGIMDVNYDFDITSAAANLMNSSFGIAPTFTVNVPTATFPYSGFGAMVTIAGKHWSGKTGVFQGNPKFLDSVFKEGYMALLELGSHWHGHDEESARYALKGGIWHDEQPKVTVGSSTKGFYGVAQTRWRIHEHPIAAFLQMGGAPERLNPVPWYLGASLQWQGTFPNRQDDSISLGMARAWIQNSHAETAYEFTYAVKLFDSCFLQPDLQYVAHPSGMNANAWVTLLRVHFELAKN